MENLPLLSLFLQQKKTKRKRNSILDAMIAQ